jgi:peptidoglycan/LPS O-acetylase OafA/YrhL
MSAVQLEGRRQRGVIDTPAAPQGTPAPVEEQLSYRADIDGLRAIAILSVVAYHAFPSIVHGGFVGVDVFFVISGYLISGIIAKGLAHGQFSLLEFYARRIRRIFPALIVVLLAIWALGWLKLLPDEYTGLAKHIAAGAVYASNLVLYKESGYFDTAAALKPLLHLWSLGVEEQFYIFWPLFLVVTWRWRPRLPVLLMITAVSFLLNVARIDTHPTSTFYLPMTRLWELSLGGALAYAQLPSQRRLKPRRRALLAGIGFALLAASIFLLDNHRLFPGWWALAPTVGTLLLIAAGQNTWLSRRLLANRAMVLIGLVSYPFYLWHWPLLSLTRIVEGDRITTADTLGAIGLAFVLALCTYYWIELPIRSVRPAMRIARPLFASVAAIGIAGFATYAEGYTPLSARFGVERVLRVEKETPYPGPRLQPVRAEGGTVYTQGAGAQRVLFMGDSNMEQYYPRIDEILTTNPEHTRGAVFVTGGGCPPIPGVHENHHPWCEGLVGRAVALARDPLYDVSTVVIGAAWQGYLRVPDPRYSYYFQDGEFNGPILAPFEGAHRAMAAFAAMVGGLARSGRKVYIILQIPDEYSFDPYDMVERRLGTLRFVVHTAAIPRREVAAKLAMVDSMLGRIARREGAETLDPLEALCGPSLCPALDASGTPIYRDVGHLRRSFVRDNIAFLDGIVTLGTPPLAHRR